MPAHAAGHHHCHRGALAAPLLDAARHSRSRRPRRRPVQACPRPAQIAAPAAADVVALAPLALAPRDPGGARIRPRPQHLWHRAERGLVARLRLVAAAGGSGAALGGAQASVRRDPRREQWRRGRPAPAGKLGAVRPRLQRFRPHRRQGVHNKRAIRRRTRAVPHSRRSARVAAADRARGQVHVRGRVPDPARGPHRPLSGGRAGRAVDARLGGGIRVG
mmetsp:Transcript_135701/g.378013  ORF Transcript_135701/g.378013 Transcript_135701/m.378013 type:complete len:219 (+) Transcript_135701:1228-1884(+)